MNKKNRAAIRNSQSSRSQAPKNKSFQLNIKQKRGKAVEVDFNGGDITSNAGVLLLSAADKRLGLLKNIAHIFPDRREPSKIEHAMLSMLRQRVYGIALGYEDLNDHDALRNDLALQTALNLESILASRSTLSRLENTADRAVVWKIHTEMFQQFIKSFKIPPKELTLDFDATDDLVHGQQEKVFYNKFYEHECFLPLYVTCKKQLLVSYLRPSSVDGAQHTWAILSILVKNLRKVWPSIKILFRGDAGFCRHKMFDWCENNNIDYVCGIPSNKVLSRSGNLWTSWAHEYFDHTQEKQRIFGEFFYRANTWSHSRRIIVKAEHMEKGANPRYLVTNRAEKPQELYEKIYCARGEMENRIKEQQLDLFADRTSCLKWWPNQLRLLFSSLAYVLINAIREIALEGTKFSSLSSGTIRLKLFKIGAIILRNTRRIRFHLSSAYPDQLLFFEILSKLESG